MRKKRVVMISVGRRRKKIQVKLVKSGPLIDNIKTMMMITIITLVLLLLLLLFIVNKYFYCTYSLN